MGLITKTDLTNLCAFGSQMSQYAAMVSISKKTGIQPFFIEELVNSGFGFLLGIPFKHKPKILKLNQVNTLPFIKWDINNGNDQIDKRVFSLPNNNNYIINGDIGLYLYWHDMKDDIIKLYEFNDDIVNFCQSFIDNNTKQNETLVSICFRRGDYLTTASLNLSLDYYYEAIKIIQEKIPNKNIKFLIFSGAAYGDDGMAWVKQNLKLENCLYAENMDRYQQMCLMSMCKHNIIANSSFPWWAAYLNKNPNKIVICPHQYVNDVRFNDHINGKYFPLDWISLNKI